MRESCRNCGAIWCDEHYRDDPGTTCVACELRTAEMRVSDLEKALREATSKEVRSKLAGWHFGQESLTSGERQILYVAEALLRQIDDLLKS